jgi:ubiquinone/menaquinone biosynthesis C-methylase UbiE
MSNMINTLLGKSGYVCPWWCCFTFDNFLRKLLQDPVAIVSKYIAPGDTVLDIGPGQGFFTIPMARLVGDAGRVIAIDVQSKMLSILTEKAKKSNVGDRIIPGLVTQDTPALYTPADFALAFWMVHEVPDRKRFLKEVFDSLKPGKLFLIAEPVVHVPAARFAETIADATSIGFRLVAQPRIAFSRSALLGK